MPIDGDTTVGPTVTLDPDGNCTIPFTGMTVLGDTYAFTTSAGTVLVPLSAFVFGPPPLTATSGNAVINHIYARSTGLI